MIITDGTYCVYRCSTFSGRYTVLVQNKSPTKIYELIFWVEHNEKKNDMILSCDKFFVAFFGIISSYNLLLFCVSLVRPFSGNHVHLSFLWSNTDYRVYELFFFVFFFINNQELFWFVNLPTKSYGTKVTCDVSWLRSIYNSKKETGMKLFEFIFFSFFCC